MIDAKSILIATAVLLGTNAATCRAESDFLTSLQEKKDELSARQQSKAPAGTEEPLPNKLAALTKFGFLWMLKGVPTDNSYSTFAIMGEAADAAKAQKNPEKFLYLGNAIQFRTPKISELGGGIDAATGDVAVLERYMNWELEHFRSQGGEVTSSGVAFTKISDRMTLSFSINVNGSAGVFTFRTLAFRSGPIVIVFVAQIINASTEPQALALLRSMTESYQTINQPLTQAEFKRITASPRP